jgi:glycerol-3-phosphate acyltransferase PlsY
VGSFPTAYLLLKWKSRLDIRETGSGNVGTLNAMEVSRSTAISAVVLVADLLKGSLAAALPMLIWGPQSGLMAAAGVAVIVGHNYPIWMRFKGGRGLAPTAGVLFVTGPFFVAAWMILWAIGYLLSKNIHIGNVAACIAAPILLAAVPEAMLNPLLPRFVDHEIFLYLIIALCSLILIRHSGPIADLIRARRSS